MTFSPPKDVQHTLRTEFSFSGRGIFTGQPVSVRVSPAPEDSGIVFYRADLPSLIPIPAKVEFVHATPRCTVLGNEGATVMLVEHLLSALYACGIDNARIEVMGPEIPGADGSALVFADLIQAAGISSQRAYREYLEISETLYWSQGDVTLVALPSPDFRLSFTFHYEKSSLIRSQYYSLFLDPLSYYKEIAPARTFSFYEEIQPLLEKGLIQGGGLDSALVIQGEQVLNPEGMRFPDEMVRHKILDLIGDLSLVGTRLRAHVIAICSGHASNVAFARNLSKTLQLGRV